VTDETLDNILSGQSEALPETNETEVSQVSEGESQQEPGIEAEGEEGETQGQRMVPQQALHAEKQKVKRYTEEVADFRKQLSESNAAWERRMAQLVEAIKPKQEQQQADPVSAFFENPEVAARNANAPQFEQISQTLLANAQLIAGIKYGDDKVAEAEQAFINAMNSRQLDPADYQKVVSSPNRYAAAVQWHRAQQAKAESGDDPVAYRAKVEAEILAKHGLTMEGAAAAEQQAQPNTVMPSNLAGARNVGSRNGPAWSGPPSLNEIFDTKRP